MKDKGQLLLNVAFLGFSSSLSRWTAGLRFKKHRYYRVGWGWARRWFPWGQKTGDEKGWSDLDDPKVFLIPF